MIYFTRKLLADRLPEAERAARMAHPGFGRVFSEHMVTAQYTPERGWGDAAVVPLGPLSISPTSAVLHYAQAIFEGLKAYEQPDGSVSVFRPEANAARFTASAVRLAMPPLPDGFFLQAIRELVETDRGWVPNKGEDSFYLRPLMFAADDGLPVRPSDTYTFVVIGSPVGSYFSGGVTPVRVWLSADVARAAPGGTGAAKCAGNYAASLQAQAQAQAQGCDQVVWLDAVEHRWVEEMGGMNLFFLERARDGLRLVTPALTGTLLPGVTRDSILRMAADLGLGAEERRVDIEEWESGCRDGRITESFACGTAAVVTPVGQVRHRGGGWTIGDGRPGPATLRIRQALLDLQQGRTPDRYGWRVEVAPGRRLTAAGG